MSGKNNGYIFYRLGMEYAFDLTASGTGRVQLFNTTADVLGLHTPRYSLCGAKETPGRVVVLDCVAWYGTCQDQVIVFLTICPLLNIGKNGQD